MKSAGIVRAIDDLGRIVIPVELRRTLDLAVNDLMEIFVDGENIVLRKYRPGCVFCGESDPQKIKIVGIKGKIICRNCTNQIIDANIGADLAAVRGVKA
jgi:transcriptional pleiotropic regulator of transition state genes